MVRGIKFSMDISGVFVVFAACLATTLTILPQFLTKNPKKNNVNNVEETDYAFVVQDYAGTDYAFVVQVVQENESQRG